MTSHRRFSIALALAALALVAAPVRGDETVVTINSAMNCTHPQWRPDGEWILYHATKPTDASFHQIRKVRPDGTGDMMVVSNSTLRLGSARWSPVTDNGSSPRYWIAYAADDPVTSGSGRIYLARDKDPGELTGVSRQRTTDAFPGHDHGAPRFSPDGAFVVFEYSAAPAAGRVAAYRAYSSITFDSHGSTVAAALPKDIFPIAMERSVYAQNGSLLGNTAIRRPVPSPDGLFVAGVRQTGLSPVERLVQRMHPTGHAFGYPDDQNTIDLSRFVIDPTDPFTLLDVVDAYDAEWRPIASETFVTCTVKLGGETTTEIAYFTPDDEIGTLLTRNSASDRNPVWNVGDGPFGCRFIAFVREGVNPQIWVVHQDPADGEFRVSANTNTSYDNPSWSPDDFTKVAYQKRVLGKWQIAWGEAFCPIH